MTNLAHQLLTECLIAQGFDREQAERTVASIMDTAVRAEIIELRHLETWETHARIYQLRGKNVRPCDLAARFEMSRSQIFDIIRRHAKQRRAALRPSDEPLAKAG